MGVYWLMKVNFILFLGFVFYCFFGRERLEVLGMRVEWRLVVLWRNEGIRERLGIWIIDESNEL